MQVSAVCTGMLQVVKVVDVRLVETASRCTTGTNKGQLLDNLKEEECWLELKVQRKRCVHAS